MRSLLQIILIFKKALTKKNAHGMNSNKMVWGEDTRPIFMNK